ncbi:hypothetical protein ACHAO9_011830 [Fusarium lateritium]
MVFTPTLQDASTHTLVSLRDMLQRAKVRAQPDGTKHFLPAGELQRICTRENVLKALEREFDHDAASSYTRWIFEQIESASKTGPQGLVVFGILNMSGDLNKLVRFKENHITDADLPFVWDGERLLTQDGRVINDPHQPGCCFMDDEDRFQAEFYREQWEILPPVLSKADMTQEDWPVFHPHAILPWTYMESKRKSMFSDVYKCECESGDFALKVLKSDDATDFEFKQELYALKKVSSESHVLDLHTAFKHGDKPCLVFKWAQGGSLSELMEMSPDELGFSGARQYENLHEWVVLQMTGLAEGLYGMHDAHDDLSRYCIGGKEDFYGIHGDVKPDNILRFTDCDSPGRLVLSDFGLTRFHTKASRSHRRGNGPVSPTYASPEHNDYICGVSRRSDVWALGCVFTEMLTWAIQGPEAHKLYECTRLSEDDIGREKGVWHMDRFFGIDFSERDLSGALGRRFLKKAVIDCIQTNKDMANRLGPRAVYINEILDFVGNEMLAVDYTRRATCDKVYRFLASVSEKLMADD